MRARATETLDGVLAAFAAAWPGADARPIRRAHEVAARAHEGQWRQSGDPYLTHAVAVAMIVAELGARQEVVCAALLHDVPGGSDRPDVPGGSDRPDVPVGSDGPGVPVGLGRLRRDFGADVADLVAEVEALDRDAVAISALRADVAEGAVPASVDGDVLLLKLADRLHNMRTMRFLPPAKQRVKSAHTLELMAPLARLLGLDPMGRELGDLASRILHPHWYAGVSPRALRVAATLLPGHARARWLEEWAGELATLPTRRARLGFVVRLLPGVPRLAITVRHTS